MLPVHPVKKVLKLKRSENKTENFVLRSENK